MFNEELEATVRVFDSFTVENVTEDTEEYRDVFEDGHNWNDVDEDD